MNLAIAVMIGLASWYGPGFEGKPTASGEPFDPSGLTAASWDFPFNTILEIRNRRTGKTVRVRINDRGPARHLNRIIDLSGAAFNEIADPDTGIIEVEIREVETKEIPVSKTEARQTGSRQKPPKSAPVPMVVPLTVQSSEQ